MEKSFQLSATNLIPLAKKFWYSDSRRTMIISDLETMEKIVARNYNLRWDGWDVIRTRKMPTAYMHKNAMRIKGKWYRTERFKLDRKGWPVPDDFIKA